MFVVIKNNLVGFPDGGGQVQMVLGPYSEKEARRIADEGNAGDEYGVEYSAYELRLSAGDF